MNKHHPTIVSFGKHKGNCIRCVTKQHPGYVRWLFSTDWFTDQYPDLAKAWESLLCNRPTVLGPPCRNVPKYGPLCATHYRMAEKAMTDRIEAMLSAVI